MGIEIERKFLLKDDSWRSAVSASTVFKQRYLPFQPGPEHLSGRIRIAGNRAFLTLKSAAKGFSRDEFEYEIPLEDAEQMLERFCTGNAVSKIRHKVDYLGHLWEIDEFLGENAGLVVAELELESEDQRFPIPPWLGEEVTSDYRYSNSVLAENPYSSWHGN